MELQMNNSMEVMRKKKYEFWKLLLASKKFDKIMF